jgi:hypothetical protein
MNAQITHHKEDDPLTPYNNRKQSFKILSLHCYLNDKRCLFLAVQTHNNNRVTNEDWRVKNTLFFFVYYLTNSKALTRPQQRINTRTIQPQ